MHSEKTLRIALITAAGIAGFLASTARAQQRAPAKPAPAPGMDDSWDEGQTPPAQRPGAPPAPGRDDNARPPLPPGVAPPWYEGPAGGAPNRAAPGDLTMPLGGAGEPPPGG